MVKNLPANTGDIKDADLISASGRSPGVGNGNPLQCSCLKQSMGLQRVGHDWSDRANKHTQHNVGENVNWRSQYGKMVRRCLKKWKTELPHDPTIPLLGIQLRKAKLLIRNPDVYNSTIYNCQDMGATYVSINRWLDKEDKEWNTTQSLKRMKFCHLQQYG